MHGLHGYVIWASGYLGVTVPKEKKCKHPRSLTYSEMELSR